MISVDVKGSTMLESQNMNAEQGARPGLNLVVPEQNMKAHVPIVVVV